MVRTGSWSEELQDPDRWWNVWCSSVVFWGCQTKAKQRKCLVCRRLGESRSGHAHTHCQTCSRDSTWRPLQIHKIRVEAAIAMFGWLAWIAFHEEYAKSVLNPAFQTSLIWLVCAVFKNVCVCVFWKLLLRLSIIASNQIRSVETNWVYDETLYESKHEKPGYVLIRKQKNE